MSEPTPPWSRRELAELGVLFRGRGGTKGDDDPDGLPCIRYGELYTHHDCIIREFRTFIARESAAAYTPIKSGDVIFAGSGETLEEIGKAAAYCDDAPALAGADTIIFRVGPTLDPRFVGYAVNSQAAVQYKSRRGQGSSVMHISAEHLGRMTLDVPPMHEQARIADILSMIDEAIEHTEALIAKTEQIKAGLMHDLFTRGIGPDGRLRPPREEAPELYKESPLGWIPNEWSTDRFGARANVIDPNPSHRYPEECADGIPICSTENFTGEDGFDLASSKLVPNSVYADQYARCGFSPNDVVFARKGRIGLARRYGAELKVFSHTVVLLKPAVSELDSPWLVWLARSFWFLGGIDARMNSNSGVPTLGVAFIQDVEVPFPTVEEQQRIGQTMDHVSASAGSALRELDKLLQLKRGLMDDLVTGRVRVPLSTMPGGDRV